MNIVWGTVMTLVSMKSEFQSILYIKSTHINSDKNILFEMSVRTSQLKFVVHHIIL